jgi:hypothetical protein
MTGEKSAEKPEVRNLDIEISGAGDPGIRGTCKLCKVSTHWSQLCRTHRERTCKDCRRVFAWTTEASDSCSRCRRNVEKKIRR